jgi:ADP-heptose:LPS heptosyltransferase
MEFKEILLIHLGGLGDFCLSESTFLSISRHFREPLVGLGTRRFFDLFENYFDRVHGIESARWLYLFSSRPSDITWEKIIFIGKDREGSLRERWQRLSRTDFLFVDMYPEGAFGGPIGTQNAHHIEDHQLAQLPHFGIEPLRKEISLKPSSRVILYPEKGFKKEKWHHHNFIELYRSLKSKGVDVYIVQPFDLDLSVPEAMTINELSDMKAFLEKGGIFVSNDSGMAHLAGACGLFTLTIFTDFDPGIWHPRGTYQTLKQGQDSIDVRSVEKIILDRLERLT